MTAERRKDKQNRIQEELSIKLDSRDWWATINKKINTQQAASDSKRPADNLLSDQKNNVEKVGNGRHYFDNRYERECVCHDVFILGGGQ